MQDLTLAAEVGVVAPDPVVAHRSEDVEDDRIDERLDLVRDGPLAMKTLSPAFRPTAPRRRRRTGACPRAPLATCSCGCWRNRTAPTLERDPCDRHVLGVDELTSDHGRQILDRLAVPTVHVHPPASLCSAHLRRRPPGQARRTPEAAPTGATASRPSGCCSRCGSATVAERGFRRSGFGSRPGTGPPEDQDQGEPGPGGRATSSSPRAWLPPSREPRRLRSCGRSPRRRPVAVPRRCRSSPAWSRRPGPSRRSGRWSRGA